MLIIKEKLSQAFHEAFSNQCTIRVNVLWGLMELGIFLLKSNLFHTKASKYINLT